MNSAAVYPYANGDLLEERNSYFYSSYHGAAFLTAWRAQRQAAALRPPFASGGAAIDDSPTATLLEELWADMEAGQFIAIRPTLEHLLQRFEVSKRVHGHYSALWRPADPEDYRVTGRYLRLAELLERAWAQSGELPWLNGLLKLLDTLCALQGRLTTDQQTRLHHLISCERAHVAELEGRLAGGGHAA